MREERKGDPKITFLLHAYPSLGNAMNGTHARVIHLRFNRAWTTEHGASISKVRSSEHKPELYATTYT